ncbi:TIGR04222 domain-containing membrane protein [Plantactinospora sp. ZYX-F-223]|uniref:TIGR04222 domain-containing membrane protein n=1 Tax=Plantactinospora sp. ZYX-F-223 TaxID=3144103 RepID=UPI0031FE1DFB
MQPWGISGPQFLLLYPIAVIAGLAVAEYARRWANRTAPAELPSAVEFAEVAFLAGGTDRVVDAAVARLVHSEQLRVNRKGGLSAPGDPASDHPIGRDVHSVVRQQPTKVHALRRRLKAMPQVRALAERVAAGQRSRSRWERALATYASLALLCLVFAVGMARLVDGITDGYPIGYLLIQLIVSMAIIPAFYIAVWPLPARTRRNNPVVALAARQLDGVDRVAVSGMAAYPDEELRAALVASATPPEKKKGRGRQRETYYSYGPPTLSSDSGGGGGGGTP